MAIQLTTEFMVGRLIEHNILDETQGNRVLKIIAANQRESMGNCPLAIALEGYVERAYTSMDPDLGREFLQRVLSDPALDTSGQNSDPTVLL